jgi:hypothetical protein
MMGSFRSRVGAAAVACVMAVGGLVAVGVAPAGAAGIAIMFDGHCDGLHLNFPSAGEPSTAYTVDGVRIGCVHDNIFGVARPNSHKVYGVDKGTEYIALDAQDRLFFRINRNQTWALFGPDAGDNIALLNSGTWSIAPPSKGHGLVASTSVRTRAVAAKAQPLAAKDIAFDGFCDGLHIANPSVGLGTSDTIDGAETGCISYPIVGARDTINGFKKTFVVLANQGTVGAPLPVMYLVFKDHTWANFYLSSGVMTQFVSGTWSKVHAMGAGLRSTKVRP